jgi:hypothetical protein
MRAADEEWAAAYTPPQTHYIPPHSIQTSPHLLHALPSPIPPPHLPPTKTTPPFRKPTRSCDCNASCWRSHTLAAITMDHLTMCPPHSEATTGHPEGLDYMNPAIPRTGETHRPIKTPRSIAQIAWTIQTGARLVLTAPSHSEVLHHLPNRHLLLP